MLNRLVPSAILALVVAETLLIVSAYVLAAYMLSSTDPMVWLLYEDGLIRIGVLVAGILFGLYLQDLYSDLRVGKRIALFQQISLVIGLAFLMQALIGYGAPSLLLPRWIMMCGSLLLLAVLPLWRIVYGTLVEQGLAAERVLFLGANDISLQVAEAVSERPELGLSVSGFVVEPEESERLGKWKRLGSVDEFRKIADTLRPDRVVVGMSERRQKLPVLDLLDIKFSGVRVEEVAATFEAVFNRVCTQQLRPSQLIFSHELGPRPGTLQIQAAYSFALALIGVVLLAPLMLIVAVIVRLTSPGPALYRQKRVGFNNEIFTVFKFRSMRQDAEAKSGAVWATRDDPRITPLGKFLRKSRIDELPQLFNVLRGEMSLVGPRPERPEFVSTLSEKIPFYRQRHFVKPGITGWAQINYKYGDTMEDTIKKLEYDLYYIKNLTPALDFYIMFHTVKVMLLSRGAQ
ncbi:MAG: sugar transferase [Bryobacteraceae bacterium]